MNIIVLLNVNPEDSENLKMVLDRAIPEKDLTTDEIQKQKKSEYDRQRYMEKKNSTVKNVEKVESTEEREKKEKESSKEKEIKDKEDLNIYISPEANSTVKPKAKPVKKPYGSGENVMLTDEQFCKLHERLPDADAWIEKASLYFGSKGNANQYKDHYMTILNWDRMDRERKAQQMNRRESWTEIAEQLSQEMELPQL